MDKKAEIKSEADFESFQYAYSTCKFQRAKDLHLELNIAYYRTSLKLLQLNAGLTL